MLLGIVLSPARAGSTGETAMQTAKDPSSCISCITPASCWTGTARPSTWTRPKRVALYKGLGAPDLILITHAHGDHLSPATLDALDTSKAIVVMPRSVADKIGDRYGKSQLIMANGDRTEQGRPRHPRRADVQPHASAPEISIRGAGATATC